MREPAGPIQPVTARRTSRMIPDITRGAFAVWFRDAKVWATFYKASLIGDLGEPLLYLVAMGWGLGKLVGTVDGVPFIEFLAPGLVCSTAMYAAVFECTFGAFTRMTRQKTYDAILASPLSLDEIVAGEVLWGGTKGFFSGGAMILVMALFGFAGSPLALLALPLAFLIGLLFACLSMIVTAKAPSYDFFSYYFTLGIAPMFLFSGVFFPIHTLPQWGRTLAWFLPLTHGVNVSRAIFTGTVDFGTAADMVWLLVFSAAAFLVSVRAIRKRLVM